MGHTTRDELQRIAEEMFGWAKLHPEQLEAMEQVMAGHDVLAVLPTGARKSAIYQVPALGLDGPTLVVSPLIALQNDQMERIEDSEAPEAVVLNSSQRASERTHAWKVMRQASAEYLFLSPEQLANDESVDALATLGIALFVIDEAHCVSAWGHDFRPDYLRLSSVIERLGRPRVIALTATAALPVRRDIVKRLGLRDHREVIASFDRPNLHLSVERFTDDTDKRSTLLTRVRALTADPATRRGLVYTASRKDTDCHARELAQVGVRVAGYHAGMKAADRKRVHEQFLADELDIVVATSAFGMGIDKPDVRFIVHASVPESLDTYYQQIGRAGRDGGPAEIILLYRAEDLSLQKFLTASKAPEDTLSEVAHALDEHQEPVRLAELKREVASAPARTTRAVNLLEQTEAVTTDDKGRLEYPDGGLTPDHAVDAAVELAEASQRLTRSRIEMMRGYAETTGCRRQFLLGYFGERLDEPCANCDTCAAGTAQPHSAGTDAFAIGSRVRHAEWGPGVVMSSEDDRITVLFDDVGYRTLSLEAVEGNNLLTSA